MYTYILYKSHRLSIKNKALKKQIDIFMTTSALLNGFKAGQVVLGSKVHKPSAPKLGPMFTQVVSTIFLNISQFKDTWMNSDCHKASPVFGNLVYKEPQGLPVDYKALKKSSFDEFAEMDWMISKIISQSDYEVIEKMYLVKRWNITSKMWTRILYDFVFSFLK